MDINSIYPKRSPSSHKGDFGKVLIIAGSERYTGSPIFNAVSALRTGADLVTVISHKRAAFNTSLFLPDIISIPLENELSQKDISLVINESKNFDSLIIGGGLDRSPETFTAIREIIKEIKIPMVIDAEAIRAIAEDTDIVKEKTAIFTPHLDEFKSISGYYPSENENSREEEAKKIAQILNSTILLKSRVDIISNGEKTLKNKTGNSFMTKGGFGDTLAGVCGALLARKSFNILDLAYLGSYINGKAGDMASEKFGESMIASDVFNFFPRVIKEILEDPSSFNEGF